MPTVVQLTETTTTLKLKVAAPPPKPPANINSCTNPKFSNWDFLQSIPKQTSEEKQSTLYTHPLTKNSPFSKLSPKSLQLCTENLGSETGSDNIVFPCSNSFIPSSDPMENSSTHLKSEFENSNEKGKSPNYCRKINNFPPPLTTMSRSSSLQVRRNTEEGRLIIEAVDAPFRNSYLQAERSDGRLKLCFLTRGGEEEEEEEEEEEDGGVDECGGEVDEIDENDEIEEARSELDEFEGERDNEMGMEKFQRMTIRCNEHEGLSNYWKPPALWVATS